MRFDGHDFPIIRAGDLNRDGAAARTLGMSRIRRGVYAALPEPDEAEQRHLLAMRAIQATAAVEPTFSHESAAVVWGIPLIGAPIGLPHVLHGADSTRRSKHGVIRHHMRCDPADIITRRGFSVTAPIRTAIDLCTARPFASAVAVVDDVLRRGGELAVNRQSLLDALAARGVSRNIRRARAALQTATGLADSPLESLCIARMAELGFAMPRQQVRYPAGDGRRSYFVDFKWDTPDVIAEADGRIKYEVDPGVMWSEKIREDELRAQCRRFLRITWDDAWRAAPLEAKLLRAGVPRR